MRIVLELTDEQAQRLMQLGQSLAVDPSELARPALNDLLSRPADDFRRAASYFSEKNKELYERLR